MKLKYKIEYDFEFDVSLNDYLINYWTNGKTWEYMKHHGTIYNRFFKRIGKYSEV